jgi:hypothetical protein
VVAAAAGAAGAAGKTGPSISFLFFNLRM